MVNLSSPIIGKNWREILSIYTREKLAQKTDWVGAAFVAWVPNGELGEGSTPEVATADLLCLLDRFDGSMKSEAVHIVAAIVESKQRNGAVVAGYMMVPARQSSPTLNALEQLKSQFKYRVNIAYSPTGINAIFGQYGSAIQMVELKGVDA
mgnify:CR=1 FL=1